VEISRFYVNLKHNHLLLRLPIVVLMVKKKKKMMISSQYQSLGPSDKAEKSINTHQQ